QHPLGPAEHLADDLGELPVVDRLLDPIARRRGFLHGDPQVDQEPLSETPLLLQVPVMAEDHETEQLDRHTRSLPRSTAAATVSASSVSRTSCVRTIHAPRS